ncbi:MAG TPA: dihydrolipoamide acetyltransferase family protein [Anaerolineales bacterium]|nr:dihydrolipoamide acetyltransferase family protein [Anaerolineales bacterium]
MADIVTMPKLGFDMAEGILVRWVKSEGEPVEKGELLAEIETDKATVEVESSFSGTIRQHLVTEGSIVPVGEPIAVIASPEEEVNLETLIGSPGAVRKEQMTDEVGSEAATKPDQGAAVETKPAIEEGFPGGVKASPLARRMAEEKGINLLEVHGTGPAGRITKDDIDAFSGASTPRATESEIARPAESFSSTPMRQDQTVSMSRLRQAVGRRMTESKQQIPHFYVTREFDMGQAMALRSQINQALEADGVKLSVNDFVIRAVALSLRDFPNLNASLSGDQVLQRASVNVGVAVAVEGGLLTIVCHNADLKSLRQISVEVREKAERARDGKVRQADIEGSTITISNLGMFDIDEFIAIINPPEAAILAIGAVKDVPVVLEGEVRVGTRMKATLSVDHRVSDGAEAARYLQSLAGFLEEPFRLLL